MLYHAPGETNDQIIVHWPAKDVLFPAANVYRAFPNLYAIRGTMTRYVLDGNFKLSISSIYLVVDQTLEQSKLRITDL